MTDIVFFDRIIYFILINYTLSLADLYAKYPLLGWITGCTLEKEFQCQHVNN